MRRFLYIFPLFLALAACERKGSMTPLPASDADSIYTYRYIAMRMVREPERCLRLLDTAQLKGTMSADSCNMMRGYVYNTGLHDRENGKQYMRAVLDREGLDHHSDVYLSTLDAFCTLCVTEGNTEEALNASLEGIGLARDREFPRLEASFYAMAGSAMELQWPGSGEQYMRQAIGIIKNLEDAGAKPKASYYMSLLAQRLGEQGRYADAAEVCRERLAYVDEMEKAGIHMPRGYFDNQRGGAYCILACCEAELGHLKEARWAAQQYENTPYAQTPTGQFNILRYYVLAGDKDRVEQLSKLQEERLLRQGDSISPLYRTLFLNKANLYKNLGDYRRALEAAMRASILQDSLTVRERDSKAAEYEIRFKTQEVQLALQKKEAKERLQWIMIAALVLILLISGIALWRNIVAKRQLRKVNHDLYDTIQQMLEQEKKAEEALEGIPVSALSGTQQLYQRIVKLMQEQKPYTDSAMNRDTLAHMMGTNYNLVADAIRECAGGQTIGTFIDDWRLRHAAEMLAHTDEPIGLIVEMSGFKSRSHFNMLFRERFKLTPSEYIRLKK